MKMKKFLNCKIDVSKKVFQPRIETKFWVKKAIQEIENCKLKIENLKILDIFAGSGAIGIAVLKNVENSFCDFVDIDERSLSQIKINLKINKIKKNRYRIIKSNLFEKIRNKPPHLFQPEFEVIKSHKAKPPIGSDYISAVSPHKNRCWGKYDFILANPPYVALNRLSEVQPNVLKEEPHIALFAGKDGLGYIKIFLKEVKKYLSPHTKFGARGKFYLEFDPQQKPEIEKILSPVRNFKNNVLGIALESKISNGVKKKGYKFKFYRDQFKKWRFLIGF